MIRVRPRQKTSDFDEEQGQCQSQCHSSPDAQGQIDTKEKMSESLIGELVRCLRTRSIR